AAVEIGGDPRLRRSAAYRKWWAEIPPDCAETVARWLSAEDLRLFLDSIERFAETTGNPVMNRLFPGRKTFLWGLYELGYVKETRLIVGRDVRDDLRRRLSPEMLRSLARLQGRGRESTSLIAIDCGPFFLVEGSHNVKLWIFVGPRVDELFS